MTNHSGWTIAGINWGMNAWEFLNKMATFSTAVRHFARRSVFQKVRTLSLGSSSHTSVAVVGTTVLETQEPSVMFQMRSPCFPLKTYLPDRCEGKILQTQVHLLQPWKYIWTPMPFFIPALVSMILWFPSFKIYQGSPFWKVPSLPCENIRFSYLFADGDVSRGGTSATQRQKFHTNDVTSVRNPVRSTDWSTE